MSVSELTIRIFLVFVPGIIGAMIETRLTNKKEEDFSFFLVRAIVYGLMSYFTLFIIYGVFNKLIDIIVNHFVNGYNISIGRFELKFFKYFVDENENLSYLEIFFATIICCLFMISKSKHDNFIRRI